MSMSNTELVDIAGITTALNGTDLSEAAQEILARSQDLNHDILHRGSALDRIIPTLCQPWPLMTVWVFLAFLLLRERR